MKREDAEAAVGIEQDRDKRESGIEELAILALSALEEFAPNSVMGRFIVGQLRQLGLGQS